MRRLTERDLEAVITAQEIYRADDDLCRSIPDFRRKLDADPQALAEELRRAG